MQTKKVFSVAKYLSSMVKMCDEQEIQDIIIPTVCPGGWAWKCDGKTEQECAEINLYISPSWLIEIPQNENIKRALTMNKKVFSVAKYLDTMVKICNEQEIQDTIIPAIYPGGWVWDCDGKTEQECKEIGYGLCPEWLIEIPQNENIDFWRNYTK